MTYSIDASLRVLALTLLVCAAPTQAQNPQPTPTRVPVIVALVDDLPSAQQPFALSRRSPREGGDVILLSSDADAETLSDAVRALLTVRSHQGDQAMQNGMFRVTARTSRRPALPWAARVLADVRREPARELARVGTARYVTIWLPPQRRR